MVRGLKQLRMLDLISLKKRNPRGAVTAVYNCLVGLYREDRAQIFVETDIKDKRQQTQVAIRKFLITY